MKSKQHTDLPKPPTLKITLSEEMPELAGQQIEVPPEGSLGLLALGAAGIIAWRQARKLAASSSEAEDKEYE